MQKNSSFIKYFFFISLIFSPFIYADSKISDGEVYSYLELSGIKASIQGMPAQVEMMSQQMQLTSADPEKDRVVISVLLEAWQEEKVNQELISYIQNNMTSAEMTQILSWLNTPLIKRIKASELAATSPDLQQELMLYMASLQSNPPTPARMAAIKELVSVTKMAENATDIAVSIVANMFKGMQAAMPEKQVSEEQIQQQVKQVRAMMSQAMSQQMVLMSYYIYRDVSDEELAEYMSFYQKSLGQKELTVVYGGMKNAMQLWGDNIVVGLSEALKTKEASE
ncbi:hypothetical protein [Thalassotalea agariperforans]